MITYRIDRIPLHLCPSLPLWGGWMGLIIMFLFLSCSLEPDAAVCQFNTRLIYRYNRENTTADNVLPQFIQSLTEYVFDQRGVLYAIHTLPGTSSFGKFVSETNLPQGKYTVIAWGNEATPSSINREQIGTTTKQEMMIYLDNAYNASLQSNAERLYYGYRTFTIEKYGVSKVNVDMTHAHCVLNITVKWKNSAEAPANTGNFYLRLRNIAPQQGFMPQYTFRGNTLIGYTPSVDTYLHSPTTIRHNIPVVDMLSPLLNHRTTATMSYEQVLSGEFVTYRYCNHANQLLSLWAGNTQLMKEVDLQRFFRDSGIELDTNLRQEFDIQIEIDGNKVVASLVEIADWEEGGSL